MRPDKVKNYMDIATVVAERSHDAETKVGVVLVNNKAGNIISTGYNGFVRGAADNSLPNHRPEKYEYIIHAELNLITNCCRNGISTENCTLISTMSPCRSCLRILVNCGITNIIAKDLYKDFGEVLQMRDVTTSIIKRDDGLYEISYSTSEMKE